jgi:hypothetical protein
MSNEPTIEQMNEVIALFMGGSSIKEHGGHRYVYYKNTCARAVSELKYHSSWGALMPVVKKIYDTLANMLKKRPPHTACQGDLIEIDIHCAIREVDILKAHGYVYQFCLWYNKKEAANDTN